MKRFHALIYGFVFLLLVFVVAAQAVIYQTGGDAEYNKDSWDFDLQTIRVELDRDDLTQAQRDWYEMTIRMSLQGYDFGYDDGLNDCESAHERRDAGS